ncbi:MAG: carbon-nitrogen hydrolase family protein [Pseudoramibacter sp.]
MKIALAQMAMTEKMEANLEKSLGYIEKAAAEDADLILFPEIQLSPFFPQYEKRDASGYLMTPDSPYLKAVQDACARHHIFASPNFYMHLNGKNYDTSFLIDGAGKILGTQKMVHVAQAPAFFEQDYYTPSDDGFKVFDTPFGKIGIVVCFDRHYPESVRTEALKGAELILVPTANITAEPDELFQWEIKVQAYQNSAYIAMCNRVGAEGAVTFAGRSIAAGPDGETLALAGNGEELLFAEMDLAHAVARREQKPYTQLRRTEFYQ